VIADEADAGHLEGEVRAHSDRVVQGLLNLLGDAMQFPEPGHEVVVRAGRHGSFVQFEVSDSERRIPEDELDSVVPRF
jgi:signal transduction histidine kinase